MHGVVSRAINVIRGSNFLQGFAGGFIGKIGSVITRGIENVAFRTAVAAGFGCAGAAASGGKCVNGAVTAAYAHIHNEMSQPADLRGQANYMMEAEAGVDRRVVGNLHDSTGAFVQGVGFMAGGAGASTFLGWAGRAVASFFGVCSFRGDTEVKTRRGMLAIRDLRAGRHWVWSRNEHTGEMSWKPVLAQYSSPYKETVTIKVRDIDTGAVQTIVSTRVHCATFGAGGVSIAQGRKTPRFHLKTCGAAIE